MAPKKDQVPPPTKGAEPTLDPDNNGETAGAGGQQKQLKQTPPAAAPAGTQKPAAVEQFGRLVIDPTKLASDEELAKLPRTNLWTELTTGDPNAKPPKLPRINADDATKLHPGTKTFLQSLDCVHYPGDSGMLAIYDKNNYGGTKPILDLTAGNIVSIHREGDVNDPNYLKSIDHLDAVLKGAALSKMTNQPPGTPKDKATVVIDTPATESGGKPSLSKLIMAYAAEKTGLHAVGSDGNKIDTSTLPPDVKKQMDTEWDKMKDQYGFKSPTEAFNPVANPPPNGAAPTAKIDPKQTVTAGQVPEMKAKDVADAIKSGKPLLLEITSQNCQWCEKEQPEMARIAAQAGTKVPVAKIDINEFNDYISHLDDKDPLKKKLSDIVDNNQFGVPAVAVFENDDLKKMKSGYQTSDQIREFANGNLSAANALPPLVTATPQGPVNAPKNGQ